MKLRTPGAMVSRLIAPFRVEGVRSRTSFVNSEAPEVAVTSTTGAAPDTVTVSATVASPSATSTRAVKPTVSRTASRWPGRKPDRS